jgi:hypothetical protein
MVTPPLNVPKPTCWLRCPFDRLQGNRLCQADKWLDAEQVGQHHRLLRQELVEGQHSVCSRQEALLPPTSLPGGLWALWLAPGRQRTEPAPRMAQALSLLPPSRIPGRTGQIAAAFFKIALSQNFILTGKIPVRWLVENATRAHIEEKVGTAFHQPPRPPFL